MSERVGIDFGFRFFLMLYEEKPEEALAKYFSSRLTEGGEAKKKTTETFKELIKMMKEEVQGELIKVE